ncbi:MAG: hypothetical protein K8T91_16900 [Planctomycetes bacterium]|nr:hypothetical protein [Planctomycetota bacterium]
MKMVSARLILGTILSVVHIALPRVSAAAEPPMVTVRLASGRSFTAAIDGKTDATTLWLRFDAPGGTLLRPVQWSRVISAHGPQGEMTAEQIQQNWPGMASRVDSPTFPLAPVVEPTNGVAPSPSEPAASRVTTILADAYAAHWGPNVESDGILLLLSPLDDYGRLTAVDGTLEVELIADFRSYLRPAPINQREPFNRVGSWTFRLTPADFAGGRPARVRLPFQAIDPQFTANIDSYGLVTMRLAVPGQGVFATSVGDVRIRPMDNIRTRIENSTGARFLPGEQTGRPVRGGAWSF